MSKFIKSIFRKKDFADNEITDFEETESDMDFNETEDEKDLVINPFNPFDNVTENSSYNGDYSEIVPQIQLEGCKIPNIPSESERKRIKRFYNIGGMAIFMHFILLMVLANMFNLSVTLIIMLINNESISEMFSSTSPIMDDIRRYINTSSISPATTILTYLTANLGVFFVGLKFAGIEVKSLFKTEKLSFGRIVQYILIGFFLQYTAGIVINLIQMLASGADANIYGTAKSLTTYYSPKYAALSILYTCIVSPVTEELVYRGLILKCFSKVSQRYGIFISAFFFGLCHGNIAQFTLAFIVGIFMAYIDIKHNSVLPSIIVHMAVNMLATSSSVITNYIGAQSILMFIMEIAVIAMVIAGIILFILFSRKNVFPRADIRQQFRCTNISMKSIGFVLALVTYLIFTVCITFELW